MAEPTIREFRTYISAIDDAMLWEKLEHAMRFTESDDVDGMEKLALLAHEKAFRLRVEKDNTYNGE